MGARSPKVGDLVKLLSSTEMLDLPDFDSSDPGMAGQLDLADKYEGVHLKVVAREENIGTYGHSYTLKFPDDSEFEFEEDQLRPLPTKYPTNRR